MTSALQCTLRPALNVSGEKPAGYAHTCSGRRVWSCRFVNNTWNSSAHGTRHKRHHKAVTSCQLSSQKKAPLKVMIAGAPAAGKGTQCVRIVDKFGLVHISAGDLLRAEVAAGSEAGKKAKSYMDNGDLVPNEVVVEMVKNRLGEGDVKERGWLLDGYPRSGEQAAAIEKEDIRPDVFILINVPDDVLVSRVIGRRMDPETGAIYHIEYNPPPKDIVDRLITRSDDTEEKARNRLRTHHSNVDAVLGYYKDIVVEVDGQQSMDEVFANIEGVLSAL